MKTEYEIKIENMLQFPLYLLDPFENEVGNQYGKVIMTFSDSINLLGNSAKLSLVDIINGNLRLKTNLKNIIFTYNEDEFAIRVNGKSLLYLIEPFDLGDFVLFMGFNDEELRRFIMNLAYLIIERLDKLIKTN